MTSIEHRDSKCQERYRPGTHIELAANAASEFLAQAVATEDLAAAAEQTGGAWQERRWIQRDDAVAPQPVVARVFALGRPSAAPVWDRVVLPGGGEAVVALYEVAAGAPESIPREDRDAQQLQLGQQAGLAELTAYAEAIRGDADVVITPEALDPIYY